MVVFGAAGFGEMTEADSEALDALALDFWSHTSFTLGAGLVAFLVLAALQLLLEQRHFTLRSLLFFVLGFGVGFWLIHCGNVLDDRAQEATSRPTAASVNGDMS